MSVLPEIRWPRSPYLVLIDFGARELKRYRGRERIGVWDWTAEDDGKVTVVLVEQVRAHGVEERREPGRVG